MSVSYADPACALTLREGLEQYFSSFEGRFDPEECSTKETGEMFRCHDAVHVVFGTNTTLREETVTDMWTLAGTDIRWADAVDYAKSQESSDILKMLGFAGVVSSIGMAMVELPKVLMRSRRMQKRWGWYDWREHLDRPLTEIRGELGLEVLGPLSTEAPAAQLA